MTTNSISEFENYTEFIWETEMRQVIFSAE